MDPIRRPEEIVTRQDFCDALNQLKAAKSLTVREIAAASDIPVSTLGGYFAGTHLPAVKPPDLLLRLLRACGVLARDEVGQWQRALVRARASPPPGDSALSGAEAHSLPVVSTVPPVERLARGPRVRGRSRLVAKIAHGAGLVHVLYGLGGEGKTTTALLVAQTAMERGVRTWWIAGENRESLLHGMQALAVELGVDHRELLMGSLPDLLWGALTSYPRPWLLIVDGADAPVRDLAVPPGRVLDGNGLIRRPGPRGTVLVTTRDGSETVWGAGFHRRLHRIDRLGVRDAGLVLRELAGTGAGGLGQATALARRLGCLPLALRVAGDYLAESARLPAEVEDPAEIRTYDGYRTALDRGQPAEFFDGQPGEADDSERSIIGRTWELSLDLLAERGMGEARALLRLLCLLGPAPIPYGLVLRAEVLATTRSFSGITGRSLMRVLRALADLSLLELSVEEGPVRTEIGLLTLHPVLRDAGRRRRGSREDGEAAAELVTRLLSMAARELDPSTPTSWPRWRVLAPHCASPVDLVRDLPGFGGPQHLEPAILAARYLRASGHLTQAERAYQALVADGGGLLADDHPVVLELRHDLSRLRLALGRPALAERDLREVLADRVRTLGPLHRDTLGTGHYLARALREAGRTALAEEIMRQTLRTREATLGSRHPDTLTSMNNVGDMLRAAGRLNEAEAMLGEVLRTRVEILGAEHPATLITRHYLAEVARDRGRTAEAELLLVGLAADCVRILGERHPRTLRVRDRLGAVLLDLDRPGQAADLLTEVLEVSVSVLGAEHPATLGTRHRRALAWAALGDRRRASAELSQVLDGRRRHLGPEHPDVAVTVADLTRLAEAG
ncbi:tetratricopeptide repeat protein [Streptosporangium sp. H16]|uniref:tetratricopeptide repeat protein n=1 Tax=Streptosporangium sp. H16 TaxID=3444184 RepID=UPI003F7A718B